MMDPDFSCDSLVSGDGHGDTLGEMEKLVIFEPSYVATILYHEKQPFLQPD